MLRINQLGGRLWKRFFLEKTAPDELENVAKKCKENEVTINDYLMAKAFLEDGTDKIIIAKDLRDVLPFYNEGALGNYSTAFFIPPSSPAIRKTLGVLTVNGEMITCISERDK